MLSLSRTSTQTLVPYYGKAVPCPVLKCLAHLDTLPWPKRFITNTVSGTRPDLVHRCARALSRTQPARKHQGRSRLTAQPGSCTGITASLVLHQATPRGREAMVA